MSTDKEFFNQFWQIKRYDGSSVSGYEKKHKKEVHQNGMYLVLLTLVTIDGLHLFWFRKLARMRVNLAGKKQGEHNSYQTKPSFSDYQSFGESQNII